MMILANFPSTSTSFLTQPTNVTIEVGDSVLIDCKVESGNDRSWYINGSHFASENNLPSGIFSLQNGLYIVGEQSKFYNQTTFQCSYSTYVGPPNWFETFYSTVGILTVVSPPVVTQSTTTSNLFSLSSYSRSTSMDIVASLYMYLHVETTTQATAYSMSIYMRNEISATHITIVTTSTYMPVMDLSDSVYLMSTTIANWISANPSSSINPPIADINNISASTVIVVAVIAVGLFVLSSLMCIVIVALKFNRKRKGRKETDIAINNVNNEAYDYINKYQIQESINVAYNFVHV